MSLFFKRGGEQRAMDWWGSDSPRPGSAVTQDSASHLGPVFAAHRHIVDFVSTLPVDAYRKGDGGERTEISTPRLLTRPDEPGGPGLVTWLGQAVYGLLTGNAVGWINETDGYGYPIGVSWLNWNDWSYDSQTRTWYVFGSPVPSSRVVHIPWITPPGHVLGLSPVEHYTATINAGLSAQEYADMKRGGGIPPTTLKNTAKTLNPTEARTHQERASRAFSKGEPFVTGSDWDLKINAIPPNQAQFIETLKLSANQVAAAYGIEADEIGGQAANSQTYSNEEHRQIKRAANMRPYIVRLERAMFRLMPDRQYIKLNTDATIRTDVKTRTEVVGSQLADGRLSLNEARVIDDRKPIGPKGDFHNVPAPTAEPNTRNEGEAP